MVVYLSIVIGLAFIVGFIAVADGNNEKEPLFMYMLLSCSILFFPITIALMPGILAYIYYVERKDKELQAVIERVALGSTYETIAPEVKQATTPDLKLLVKAARSGAHKLPASTIEIIKRELIDRAAESGLLK